MVKSCESSLYLDLLRCATFLWRTNFFSIQLPSALHAACWCWSLELFQFEEVFAVLVWNREYPSSEFSRNAEKPYFPVCIFILCQFCFSLHLMKFEISMDSFFFRHGSKEQLCQDWIRDRDRAERWFKQEYSLCISALRASLNSVTFQTYQHSSSQPPVLS